MNKPVGAIQQVKICAQYAFQEQELNAVTVHGQVLVMQVMKAAHSKHNALKDGSFQRQLVLMKCVSNQQEQINAGILALGIRDSVNAFYQEI